MLELAISEQGEVKREEESAHHPTLEQIIWKPEDIYLKVLPAFGSNNPNILRLP